MQLRGGHLLGPKRKVAIKERAFLWRAPSLELAVFIAGAADNGCPGSAITHSLQPVVIVPSPTLQATSISHGACRSGMPAPYQSPMESRRPPNQLGPSIMHDICCIACCLPVSARPTLSLPSMKLGSQAWEESQSSPLPPVECRRVLVCLHSMPARPRGGLRPCTPTRP
jgi:hypothetical protein